MQNVQGLVGWRRDQIIAVDDPPIVFFRPRASFISFSPLAQLCQVCEDRK